MTESRGSVTGKRLILEIVQEMRDGLHPLLYSRVAPGLYCVYLHPDDFSLLEGLVPRIRVEAERALNEELRRLNGPAQQSPLSWFVAAEQNPPVEAPASGWAIQIEPDRDGEVALGTFVILSKLTLPPLPQFEGGTPTTKVFKTLVAGETRTKTQQVFAGDPEQTQVPLRASAPIAEPEPPPRALVPPLIAHAAPTHAVPTHAGPTHERTERPERTERTERTGQTSSAIAPLAEIVVHDARGTRVFVMDRPDIKIGRGGQFRLVDLQVDGSTRISRVHARIRRDAQGRFFIKDLSEWGTTVNGQRIARGVVREGDEVREIEIESELPPRARVGLADVLFLEFSAMRVIPATPPVSPEPATPSLPDTPAEPPQPQPQSEVSAAEAGS